MVQIRIRTCLNLFVAVTWISLPLYYLVGQLLMEGSSRRKSISILNPHLDDKLILVYESQDIMVQLGFGPDPKLYPQSYHDLDQPVFVSAVSSNHFEEFLGFLRTKKRYFPNNKLVVYNLGLSEDEVYKLFHQCKCVIRNVQWERFPSHLRDLKNYAFKPVLLQEALQEFGAIFWCDSSVRFFSNNIEPILEQAQDIGLVAWPIAYPTSTLTHYNMFRYFNTSYKDYYFHRMVEPGKTVIYNTNEIHRNLMWPWVKCALDLDCMAPIGSQLGGCNFNRKPKYIYAGCHRYDMSAFNVILGQMFNFEQPYIGKVNILHLEKPGMPKFIDPADVLSGSTKERKNRR